MNNTNNYPSHWRTDMRDMREVVAELEAAGWRIYKQTIKPRHRPKTPTKTEADFVFGPSVRSLKPQSHDATRALHEVQMGRSVPMRDGDVC